MGFLIPVPQIRYPHAGQPGASIEISVREDTMYSFCRQAVSLNPTPKPPPPKNKMAEFKCFKLTRETLVSPNVYTGNRDRCYKVKYFCRAAYTRHENHNQNFLLL